MADNHTPYDPDPRQGATGGNNRTQALQAVSFHFSSETCCRYAMLRDCEWDGTPPKPNDVSLASPPLRTSQHQVNPINADLTRVRPTPQTTMHLHRLDTATSTLTESVLTAAVGNPRQRRLIEHVQKVPRLSLYRLTLSTQVPDHDYGCFADNKHSRSGHMRSCAGADSHIIVVFTN